MYTIIGSDGREYGPIDSQTLQSRFDWGPSKSRRGHNGVAMVLVGEWRNPKLRHNRSMIGGSLPGARFDINPGILA
jgi:hypothetical protein